MHNPQPEDFYLVPKKLIVLELLKMVLSQKCPPDMKKGVPAGTPLVAGLSGICNSITEHIIHKEMKFVNSIRWVYGSMVYYARNGSCILRL